MTIIEAINTVDAMKPNTYTQSEKVAWLSTVDGMVKRLIIDTHETDEEIEFDGYDDDTDIDTELLVPAPYDREFYVLWLESQIDYSNSEYAKYNNGITKFNDIYQTYANDYNRNNLPIGTKRIYF